MSKGKPGSLLRRDGHQKLRVEELTEKFVNSPDSTLASIHPAFEPPASDALVSANVAAVESANSSALVALNPSGGVVTTHHDNTTSSQDLQRSDKTADLTIVSTAAGDEESSFKEAIRHYEATARDKYKTGIDPDKEHTMAELWTVIDHTLKDYSLEDKRSKVWSRIHLAFRKLGDGQGAFEGWLGLLPTQSQYMSVVCGGLKLIIKAVGRMRIVAKTVLEALVQIPAILSGAQRVLNIFKGDRVLEERSKSLYSSTLAALGRMLEYLKRNGFRKALVAALKQDSFEVGLEDRIRDLTIQRNAFNEQAEICHWEAMKKMREKSDATESEIKDELRRIGDIVDTYQPERMRAQDAIQQAVELMGMSYAKLRRDMRTMENRIGKRIEEQIAKPLEGLVRILQDSPMALSHVYLRSKRLSEPDEQFIRGITRRNSVMSIIRRERTVSSPDQHRRNLLSQLDYDPDSASNDVATNYILGSTLSGDSQERSIFVIKSRMLADWVEAEVSTVLVINGNANRVDRKSALSFVCARLVYALDNIRSPPESGRRVVHPDIVTLHFFCGQHDTGDESWESPAGIVNSLLAQLLTQCRDVEMNWTAVLSSKVDSGSVKEVFDRFKIVMKLLPVRTTVFCVIDGISFYINKHETEMDSKWLVNKLLRLTRRLTPHKHATLKLLLTAPTYLHMTNLELGDGELLSVKSVLPNTGGFTSMRWDLGVGQQLERLAESDE